MKNEKLIASILDTIPEDYRKNVESLEIKTSFDGIRMLIFGLSRDQRLKFKKLIPLLENEKNVSFYTKYNSKFYHMGGFTHVFDKINDYSYNISPFWPLKEQKMESFYRNIKNSSPKGTTRNAIIINTHCGLIPIHISKLYNRLYCVDVDKNNSIEAKFNLRINKINNCMLFESNVGKWLKDFDNYKYTPPGRKHKIGLAVCDCSLMTKETCKTLLNIEPETILFFSENENNLKELSSVIEAQENYEKTFESFADGFYMRKIKRKEKIEK